MLKKTYCITMLKDGQINPANYGLSKPALAALDLIWLSVKI
jgi:hypothetical protein